MDTTTITTNEPKPLEHHMTEPWLVRLMHLVSPSLPTGGFAYSQGLEWTVEKGWINNETSLEQWLLNVLETGMTHVDIPLLQRLYRAVEHQDLTAFTKAAQWVRACRETKELRNEEEDRGRAMAAIIKELGLCRGSLTPAAQKSNHEKWQKAIASSQLAGFAFAAAQWDIPVRRASQGYLWSWLENQVMAAVKIIPLGQSSGQRVLANLSPAIHTAVAAGLKIETLEQMGNALPALSMASSCHETQYTRLFRS
ncbi:MAG: urease accessory protein UreF [Desulfobacterales bacterium]|nr:urease accessory protein UreF [Desulfobacterales bacterium]